MSSIFKVSRALRPALARSFHSPFAVLANSNLASPPPASSNVSPLTYDKQSDVSSEPTHSHFGLRTYVVSQPDPADTYYHVPSGAYPTSLPYVNFTPTEAPESVPMSSTSSSPPHPVLTRAAAAESGAGLADRNPPPIGSDVVEKFSKMGVQDAWKARK